MKPFINLLSNILRSNLGRLKKPYKLTLALSYRCNSKCTICKIWKKNKTSELTTEELKEFFYKNNYFNWIDLTGGEVFLRKDLLEIVKVILDSQKNLYFLHIPTNGLMSNIIVQNIKKILDLSPNRFVVSIAVDGPPVLHDSLRGVKDGWKKAVKTFTELKKMKSKKFDCYLGMTLFKNNKDYIEETYLSLKKEYKSLTRKDIHFNVAHNSKNYYQNREVNLGVDGDLYKCLENFNKKKKLALTPIGFLENVYQKNIKKFIKTKQTPFSCKAFSASIFIDPKGDVYPCTMWSKKAGSIKETNWDLNKIWQNKQIIDLILKNKCGQCWTPCEAYQTILGNLSKINELF